VTGENCHVKKRDTGSIQEHEGDCEVRGVWKIFCIKKGSLQQTYCGWIHRNKAVMLADVV
jgi:hypothetical protein